MSGGFPFAFDGCNGQDLGSNTAASTITTVTAGSGNVKGAWVQLAASTAGDIGYLEVEVVSATGGRQGLLDIGVGASGSEVAIYSNIVLSSRSGSWKFYLPASIPSGSRVSARLQDTTASYAITMRAVGFSNSFASVAGDLFGEGIGVTSGGSVYFTAVTPNPTANTLGAYAQIVSATAHDYSGIIFQAAYITNATFYLFNIAIGPSGSEKVIVPDISFVNLYGHYPVSIPAGTRISINCQNAAASATACNACLVGILA